MIDSILHTIELIRDYFLNGFLALIAVAVAAPLLGVQLVLRRMPLLGLAIPQMAGCGQAASYCLFALLVAVNPSDPAEPGHLLQVLGSFGGITIGLVALAATTRDRRFLGVHAGILFLVAIGLREILYLESPYHRIFEDAIHHGRLLTVLGPGRDQVLISCAAIVIGGAWAHGRQWLSAFDPDQARLLGISPPLWLCFTLLLLGILCGFCVPVVGPEVVLTLLLIPPAIIRPVTPSLTAYGPLSVLAGVLGAVLSFVIACAEGIDWPPAPALIVSVLLSSWFVAASTYLWSAVRRRSSSL